MPWLRFLRAQGFCMTFLCGFESFKRHALRGQTTRRHQPAALPEHACPSSPRPLIEFGDDAYRCFPQRGLLGLKRSLQMRADGIVFRPELLDPLVYHLGIAQCAQSAEKL